MSERVASQLPKLLVWGVVIGLYFLAQLPSLSEAERTELGGRFAFVTHTLPNVERNTDRVTRDVHPDFQHLVSWISSVGAAVAFLDLDRDGLCNEIVYTDTRTDRVIVAPAPGGESRFLPFLLEPDPLPYDPATMAPMGCLPGDFNEDGATDILVYYWGRTPVLFLHGADPRMTPGAFVPQELVRGGPRWFTNAATQADVDGDGHVDLVFGNYFQDDAAVLDASGSLPQRMQDSMSRAFNGGTNRLYLWSQATAADHGPSVEFEEAVGVFDAETARGWTLALGASDLDGDLLPELYFANDFGPDRLLHNRSTVGKPRFERLTGTKTFTTPSSKVLGKDSFKGMGVDFGDVNGDGYPDIFISNIAAEYMLEESHFLWESTGEIARMASGHAPYVDRGESRGVSRSGWGWDTKLADFDNDGVLEAIQATGFVKGSVNRWPELHELAMGNDDLLRLPGSWPVFQPGDDLSGHQPNPFYVMGPDGRYFDIAAELGLDTPQVTRGLATADMDGDGDLDFAVGNQWDVSRLYENVSPAAHASLILDLVLPAGKGYRPAIGAAVSVRLSDGTRLTAQVDGGNGHSGVRSPEVHFGLGSRDDRAPLEVTVHYRDHLGVVRTLVTELSAGRHQLRLGSDDANPGRGE